MGGAKTIDLRGLVPRIPPEGLRAWTLQHCKKELERYGLVYEVEYVQDYGLLQMLDEYSRPKKVKMVRVTCSCCGESMLLHWGYDQRCGYGFINLNDVECDWGDTVTAAGDETACPICGARVLVKKSSAIKPGSYFVTAECSVMSASVVGEENLLVLTDWTVQNRVYKRGNESLEFIPHEAFVFDRSGCTLLRGWRNGYSGTAGYFSQYLNSWNQPKKWNADWVRTDAIYGLTLELIDRSCLPHCKLDIYMAARIRTERYPVAWLRLYQAHPNAEAVLLHGLPVVLDDLICQRVGHLWHNNHFGDLPLPELNWNATRPAQMLHLTKEELRMAKGQCWGLLFWDLFVQAKAAGELLTAEDITNAFRLGDDHVGQLVGRGPVSKSILYLLRQCEAGGVEAEDEDPQPYDIPDVQMLTDYWTMSENLGRNLDDPAVRFPNDLVAAHDNMTLLMSAKVDADRAQLFRIRRKLLSRWAFAADGFLIRPAGSQAELVNEGDKLSHCVSTYGEKHASGKSAIFFIRRMSKPKEPYYTLELDEKTLTVRQNRGKRNCARTPEVQAFEELWLRWLRMGAPKDRRGRPIRPDGHNTRGRAAC